MVFSDTSSAYPEPGGIKELKDSPVTPAFGGAHLRGLLKQPFHLRFRQEFRQAAPHSRSAQGLSWVLLDGLLLDKEIEKGLQGGHFSCGGGVAVTLSAPEGGNVVREKPQVHPFPTVSGIGAWRSMVITEIVRSFLGEPDKLDKGRSCKLPRYSSKTPFPRPGGSERSLQTLSRYPRFLSVKLGCF